MHVISDVMHDNETENNKLTTTLEATEHKLGGLLTSKKLADYRNSRKISLSTSPQTNQKLLNKCKSKLKST